MAMARESMGVAARSAVSAEAKLALLEELQRCSDPVTAAKSGLLGLIRALAAELGPFGIRANMVMPGFIDTERRYAHWYPEFRERPPGSPAQLKDIPLGRLGRPEEIADACLFLASDASAYITGDAIRVMGGRIIG